MFSQEDLTETVAAMTLKKSLSMRKACLERAEEFGMERFAEQAQKAFLPEKDL